MRIYLVIMSIFILSFLFYSCTRNDSNPGIGCDATAVTTRKISIKKATVKLTATAVYPVYLVEEGSIDTKLVPCNFPVTSIYYQNDLQVIISGDVKAAASNAYGPCCFESFVITSISR